MSSFNYEFEDEVKRSCDGSGRPAAPAFFLHFAPPPVTCSFIHLMTRRARYGLVLVEGCGVEWGPVE